MTTKRGRNKQRPEPRRTSAQPKRQNKPETTPDKTTAEVPETGERPVADNAWNDRRYADE